LDRAFGDVFAVGAVEDFSKREEAGGGNAIALAFFDADAAVAQRDAE
jgi:hypothetical protein